MKFLLIHLSPDMFKDIYLCLKLRWGNCDVLEAQNEAEGMEILKSDLPEAVLLGASFPGFDWLKTIKKVRAVCDVPIIVVSHKMVESDLVQALDMGADDYMVSPVDKVYFVCRAAAIMRRACGRGVDTSWLPPLVSSRLRVDFVLRKASLDGKQIEMTPTEYELFRVLARNVGKLVSLDMLKESVGGDRKSATIRKHISSVRHKVGDNSGEAPIIRNERGIGYRLVV